MLKSSVIFYCFCCLLLHSSVWAQIITSSDVPIDSIQPPIEIIEKKEDKDRSGFNRLMRKIFIKKTHLLNTNQMQRMTIFLMPWHRENSFVTFTSIHGNHLAIRSQTAPNNQKNASKELGMPYMSNPKALPSKII